MIRISVTRAAYRAIQETLPPNTLPLTPIRRPPSCPSGSILRPLIPCPRCATASVNPSNFELQKLQHIHIGQQPLVPLLESSSSERLPANLFQLNAWNKAHTPSALNGKTAISAKDK